MFALVIPVYIINFRTDESLNRYRVIFCTYNDHFIAQTQDRICIRNMYMSILQNTRADKISCQKALNLRKFLSTQCCILYFQGNVVRLQVRICLFFFLDIISFFVQIYPTNITDKNK